jgi:hypothetical protein
MLEAQSCVRSTVYVSGQGLSRVADDVNEDEDQLLHPSDEEGQDASEYQSSPPILDLVFSDSDMEEEEDSDAGSFINSGTTLTKLPTFSPQTMTGQTWKGRRLQSSGPKPLFSEERKKTTKFGFLALQSKFSHMNKRTCLALSQALLFFWSHGPQ